MVLPPTSLILLAFVGALLTQKLPKTGRIVAILSLSVLLILSLPITANVLLHSLESIPPITASQLKEAQAIVILGGGNNIKAPEFNYEDSNNRWTLERIRYGAYLQKQTGKPILVSGGAPYGGSKEADVMAEALQRDFHAWDIWTESQSKNTAENATMSATILRERDVERIALVSQPWHLSRATMLFEQQGLTVFPAPTGYSHEYEEPIIRLLPSARALNNSTIALREYLGYMWNRVQ